MLPTIRDFSNIVFYIQLNASLKLIKVIRVLNFLQNLTQMGRKKFVECCCNASA